MTRSAIDVSVILPAYNEEDTLESTVTATVNALIELSLPNGFEVIIAEDGCTDRTPEVAARLADELPTVRHLHEDGRLGRGAALERAFGIAEGDVMLYFDTDLATDLAVLGDLIDAVRSEGYDIATGSRLLPESDVDRSLGREVPSRVYNRLVRLLLDSTVLDHQCGCKAFDRAVVDELLDAVDASHWFWDTELLVRAQDRGFRVAEVPVTWRSKGDSTVDVPRDTVTMGGQLLLLTWQLRVAPALNRYRGIVTLALTLILGYFVLAWVAEPGAILERIASIDPTFLVAAGGVYLLSWPIRGARYRDILRELGYHEGIGFLTGAIFLSQTGNLLVPARAGDAIRAYVVKARRGVPYPSGFASLAVERIFDLLTIVLLAGGVVAGLVMFRGTASVDGMFSDPAIRGGQVAIAVAIGVAAVVLLGFVALIATSRIDDRRWHRIVGNRPAPVARTLGLLGRFLIEIRRVSTRPRAVLRIGVSSVAIWSIDVLTAILVLAAFGVDMGLGPLLVIGFFAVSIGNLAKLVPISPGGIGLYEAGFAALVVGLTPIPVPTAIGAAIVDHALKNIITGAGGVVSMAVLNVSLVTAAREGRAGVTTDVPARE